MSASDPSSSDGPKREILRPDDTLLDVSTDPDERAEAHARAARRVLEEEARRKQAEEDAKLGWHGRLWRRLRAFVRRNFAGPWAAVAGFFQRRLPRFSSAVATAFGVALRAWLTIIWPFIDRISHRTNEKGERKLSLVGRVLITAVVFFAAWPFFKIYYVLGTTRHFHAVQITFKQIISHDRYLVFGDYKDEGQSENMAFNVTDSWVYWNWTPDLTFAQIPLVGACSFRTYGWYVRVPRFVPFIGRTLLVEPVIIEAQCTPAEGMPGASTPSAPTPAQ